MLKVLTFLSCLWWQQRKSTSWVGILNSTEQLFGPRKQPLTAY